MSLWRKAFKQACHENPLGAVGFVCAWYLPLLFAVHAGVAYSGRQYFFTAIAALLAIAASVKNLFTMLSVIADLIDTTITVNIKGDVHEDEKSIHDAIHKAVKS